MFIHSVLILGYIHFFSLVKISLCSFIRYAFYIHILAQWEYASVICNYFEKAFIQKLCCIKYRDYSNMMVFRVQEKGRLNPNRCGICWILLSLPLVNFATSILSLILWSPVWAFLWITNHNYLQVYGLGISKKSTKV